MPDFAENIACAPTYLSTLSRYFAKAEEYWASDGIPASRSSPGANVALYVSFCIPFTFVARRAFWGNGTTVSSNKDIGIYSYSGSLIWSSGSTAQSGASALQYVSISPVVVLTPGRYYLGLSCVSSATTEWGVVIGGAAYLSRAIGIFQEASAVPLPATMTPAVRTGTTLTLFGLTSEP